MDTSFIRPSILPKLVHCGHYRSAPAGAAAHRGTRIDALFRCMIEGTLVTSIEDTYFDGDKITLDEWRAADWMASTARLFADGHALDATEEGCAIEINVGIGRPLTGTGDLVCPTAQWSADAKSGQRRDYESQQACYALGYMDRYFCDEWTVRLLYCDEEFVETHYFTRDSAVQVINKALALWRSQEGPVANDYCGWCVNRLVCPARLERVGQWVTPADLQWAKDPPEVLDDKPIENLRDFVLMARELQDWVDAAKDIMKARLDAGEKCEGVKLVSKRGSRRVEPWLLFQHRIPPRSPEDILKACAPLTEAKAKELVPDMDANLLVTEAPGRVELHLSRPKSPKPTNS